MRGGQEKHGRASCEAWKHAHRDVPCAARVRRSEGGGDTPDVSYEPTYTLWVASGDSLFQFPRISTGLDVITFKSKSVKFTFLLFFDSIQNFCRAVSEKRSGLADFEDFSPNLKFF